MSASVTRLPSWSGAIQAGAARVDARADPARSRVGHQRREVVAADPTHVGSRSSGSVASTAPSASRSGEYGTPASARERAPRRRPRPSIAADARNQLVEQSRDADAGRAREGDAAGPAVRARFEGAPPAAPARVPAPRTPSREGYACVRASRRYCDRGRARRCIPTTRSTSWPARSGSTSPSRCGPRPTRRSWATPRARRTAPTSHPG